MKHANAPVLLVDSNRDGLDLYSTALALEGITAATAATAREAFDRVVSNRPRVLVTELRLPDSDGAELIRRVRRDAPRDDVFIVALTTNAPADTARARAAGCDVVLSMPCLPDTLVGELRRVLP